jgi:hypothetical protein
VEWVFELRALGLQNRCLSRSDERTIENHREKMSQSLAVGTYTSDSLEADWERIEVQGQIGLETPVSKITRIKLTEGVAQGVECLLCKFVALSSNLSQPKIQRYKRYSLQKNSLKIFHKLKIKNCNNARKA